MAAYKKGTQFKSTIPSIGNKIPTIGTTTTINPPVGASLTSKEPNFGQMQGSFDKMFGSAGGPSSMASLESASMRLADAASRRNISESEAAANIQAKQMGYSGLGEQRYKTSQEREEAERKRKREEEDQEKRDQGMIKVGGRWMTPVRL